MINREMLDLLFGDEPRHNPQRSNASTWKAPLVTLWDGRQVPSDSEAWRAECEARHMLSLDKASQLAQLERVEQKRGHGSSKPLLAMMGAVEPAYVLDLPLKEQRQAYLATVARVVGPRARSILESKVLDLWNSRKSKACTIAAE